MKVSALKPALAVSSFLFATTPAVTAAEIPTAIAVPEGATLILSAHAKGVQIYKCKPANGDPSHATWILEAPEATLFDAAGKEIGKHSAGPKWRLDDGSEVTGKKSGEAPGPASGDITQLRLEVETNSHVGKLADARWVQRLDTKGGSPPTDTCTQGDELRVSYTATYEFFSEPKSPKSRDASFRIKDGRANAELIKLML